MLYGEELRSYRVKELSQMPYSEELRSYRVKELSQMSTPVRVKDLPRIVPIAYSFQCALAVPRAYSRRNSMLPMPHRDS